MTQPNLVQLAQTGDAAAIAALMNSTLQAIGVTARVAVRDNALHILLESERALAPGPAITFIQRGLQRLDLIQLSSAYVYSRLPGHPAPDWVQQINLGNHPPVLTNPFVLSAEAEIESARAMADLQQPGTWRRVRLFDLLLLSVPLLVVFSSWQIWSRYLSGSSVPAANVATQSSPTPRAATASPALTKAMARAKQAVKLGETATTRAAWHQAADTWWQAIALLKTVPANASDHPLAQRKIREYQNNLEQLARDKLSATAGGMELLKEITGNIAPKSIVYSGKDLFFAQNMMYRHSITVYDRDYNLVKTIPDTVKLADSGYPQFQGKQQGSPVEAAFSQNGEVAWVSNYQMYGAGLKSSGDDICSPANDNEQSFVYRISTRDLQIQRAIQVGAVPKFVATTANQNLVLVSNWCSWDVSVIDTQKNREIRRIQVGPYPRGIAIDSRTNTGYVAIMGGQDIAAIDLKTFKVKWLKGIGPSPRHLNLDPSGTYLYASLNGSGRVAKIALNSGKVVNQTTTGNAPRSMALSPDGQFLYVVNYDSDSVSKIRTQDMKVVQSVKVNPAPIGITYDPKTHQVWVACYSGSILVFQD